MCEMCGSEKECDDYCDCHIGPMSRMCQYCLVLAATVIPGEGTTAHNRRARRVLAEKEAFRKQMRLF